MSTGPDDTTGWDASADAWIRSQGEHGDWGRRYVLDAPMRARITGRGYRDALDLGCGEGRFCRWMRAEGLAAIGIDPTPALIARARALDPGGDYRVEAAEALGLPDASVDLVVAYLSLIDIADLDAALREVHRVLRPGGRLLVANLQPFNTAAIGDGWRRDPLGRLRFSIDHYLTPRVITSAWRGIRIHNHHRPLEAYLQPLLALGFALEHFAEPAPEGVDDAKAARYRRVPNFLVMEWRKG